MTTTDTNESPSAEDQEPTFFKDDLQALAAETVRHVRQKIENGTATAADLSAAVGLLRDNRIQAEVRPEPEAPLAEWRDEEDRSSCLDDLPPPSDYYQREAAERETDSQLRRVMQTAKGGLN